MPTLTGSGAQSLDVAFMEHFNPGDQVELRLGLPRVLDYSEIVKVGDYLADNGLDVSSIGMRDDELRLVVTRPMRPTGVAILPLAVLIIAALGIIAIGAIAGWKLSDAISQNIIPIALLAGGILAVVLLSGGGWTGKTPVGSWQVSGAETRK